MRPELFRSFERAVLNSGNDSAVSCSQLQNCSETEVVGSACSSEKSRLNGAGSAVDGVTYPR